MRRFLGLIIILVFTCFFIPSVKAGAIKIPDKIRVVVAENAEQLKLSVRGRYRITTVETGQLLKEGQTFFDIKVIPTQHGLDFGPTHFKIYAIEIIPEAEAGIYLGKRLYRGTLQILRTKEGHLRAINVVELEDYLRGVLYHEVSHRWPMETIKAQAIVSRTFALYQAQQSKDSYYYLKADTSSQVYGGRYAERYRPNQALEETRGLVLTYRGELLPAFFHATCGGRSEDASRLWKVDLAPLKGVACPFCRNSPHFFWKCDLRLSDIEKDLGKGGYKIAEISSIEIEQRDASGRVVQLAIKGKSSPVKVSAKDFRHLLGPTLIKSTNFTVDIVGHNAHFEGRGWGHGVGMCQWGAFTMAKKGMTAKEILRYYYPGARIVTLETKKD